MIYAVIGLGNDKIDGDFKEWLNEIDQWED
jgi:hypothetical protein